jgi:hypothetical protein
MKTEAVSVSENAFKRFHFILKIVTTSILWAGFFWLSWLLIQDIFRIFLGYFGDMSKLFSSLNLTRVGLILQFIGLFVVLPELVKRESADRWEKWFHTASKKSRSINFTIKDLFLVSPLTCFETEGAIGLINLIGRGLYFFYLLVMIITFGFWNMISGPILGKIMVTGITVFWIFGCFFLTYTYLTSTMRGIELSNSFRSTYSFFNLATIGIWFVVFISISLIVLVVLKALRGIAENPLEKILTQATFPFIFIGTGLELIAAFV